MKPKDFIEKYNISSGWRNSIQKGFLNDLTEELISFLELYKAKDNIKGFDNSVKVIRMKWDAISNKISYGLPEGVWRYFYATVIVPMRKEFCPKEVERRERIAEERRQEYEEEKRFWERSFFEDFYSYLAFMFLSRTEIPQESFDYLGISSNASVEEISSAYRKLALQYHPDKGGSQEKFIELTNHKNRCIKWVQNTQK